MTPDNFAFLARLLQRRAGHVLTLAKLPLVDARLTPVMRRFNFRDLDQLVADLRLGHETLAEAVTDAMMVSETSFFRDLQFFADLRTLVLPPLLAARSAARRLRIWCAACAAGQEAYSVAMTLDGMGLAAAGWTIDLVATDLSQEAVARAEEGRYSFFEAQRGLSAADIAQHFRESEGGYRIAARLRRMVRFRRFNLLDSYGWLDGLDLVLCRNVLLYFDAAAKASVLERMADAMASDGVLAMGDTESPPLGLYVPLSGVRGFYAPRPLGQRPAAAL